MIIKICGITRREDGEAAVEAGATAIGFVFYPPSPRRILPQRAAEIGAGLNVWKVGVFVNETPASVEAVMRAAKLDVAQIYGGDVPASVRVWRSFRMVKETFDPAMAQGVEAIVLDGPANGISFDWKLAATGTGMTAPKLILAGGLDASNVAGAIRIARPWGVDASSKLESAPGIKDHEKMRRFIDAARDVIA